MKRWRGQLCNLNKNLKLNFTPIPKKKYFFFFLIFEYKKFTIDIKKIKFVKFLENITKHN
jgi:hypothetical protein